MLTELKKEIKYLSDKKIRQRRELAAKDKYYRTKFATRSGVSATIPKQIKPVYLNRHFDPIHCKRHANFLAKTLWHKCLDGTYEPQPSVLHEIDKVGGGKREIMEFGIPDAALARIIYRRLTKRNLKKNSSNSYAYRPDRNLFDALIRLRNAIDSPKVFLAQYDFAKYFDSIPHAYLIGLIEDKTLISTTATERHILKVFLKHNFATPENYVRGYFVSRKVGTPQGSSISLILANLANDPLDKELEKLNGQFVRYADDVVNIAYTYADALRIEKKFHSHCKKSGISLNTKKSKGISVLSQYQQEIRNISNFTFLGYKIGPEGFQISDNSVSKLKQKISNVIDIYLLRHPRIGLMNHKRSTKEFDWDLLGCISEIRNIIYGGLKETRIERFLKDGTRPTSKKIRGYMSFYCLVDKGDELKKLDGWLKYSLLQAYKIREERLKCLGIKTPLLTEKNLISGYCYIPQKNKSGTGLFEPEVRLPSFLRGWRAARKFYFVFGLGEVIPPKYGGYGY